MIQQIQECIEFVVDDEEIDFNNVPSKSLLKSKDKKLAIAMIDKSPNKLKSSNNLHWVGPADSVKNIPKKKFELKPIESSQYKF